jgi:CRISPR-associated protein Cmr3
VAGDPLAGLERPRVRDGRLRLYLATPAVFEQGWLPDAINGVKFEGAIDGVRLRLVGAAVGRAVPVAGWDAARAEPKPLYWAVPAGSVYFFKVDSPRRADGLAGKLHGSCRLQELAGRFGPLAQAGFGLGFVGTWDWQEGP